MLADGDQDGSDLSGSKESKERKESMGIDKCDFGKRSDEAVEGKAVDKYLDDDEWEKKSGGNVDIQRFPGLGEGSSSREGRDGSGRGG